MTMPEMIMLLLLNNVCLIWLLGRTKFPKNTALTDAEVRYNA